MIILLQTIHSHCTVANVDDNDDNCHFPQINLFILFFIVFISPSSFFIPFNFELKSQFKYF